MSGVTATTEGSGLDKHLHLFGPSEHRTCQVTLQGFSDIHLEFHQQVHTHTGDFLNMHPESLTQIKPHHIPSNAFLDKSRVPVANRVTSPLTFTRTHPGLF